MVRDKGRRGRSCGKEIEYAHQRCAKFSRGRVLPAMVELFPPGALIIRRGTNSPIRRKGVSFKPVKDVECYGRMCYVDKCPCLKVMKSWKKTDQKPHGGYNAKIKCPCGGGVEPFHANIVRLGSVAGLHGKREKDRIDLMEKEDTNEGRERKGA